MSNSQASHNYTSKVKEISLISSNEYRKEAHEEYTDDIVEYHLSKDQDQFQKKQTCFN